MRSVLAATLGVSAFAIASTATIHGAIAARVSCPKGYSLLGEICLSDATGDIVLPINARAIASSQAKERRR